MPYRRPKRPYVLPVVTIVAVAAPLATAYVAHGPGGYRPANENGIAAVPARMAEVALAAAPDVTLPLRELTGLNLPDLHLSDLRALPLPTSIPLPGGLPSLVPGMALPSEIPLPQFDRGTTTTTTPGGVAPQGVAPATPAVPQAIGPGTPASSPQAVASAGTPNAPQAVTPATTPNAPGFPPLPQLQAPPVPLPVATPVPTADAVAGERLRAAPGSGSAAPGLAPVTATTTDPAPAGRSPRAAGDAVIPAGADPSAPALSPGAVPAELTDRVGATVKELTRDTPFSLVAFTAKDLAGTTTMVRAKQADGSWGAWYATDPVDTRRSDHFVPSPDDRTGTEPIYVGETKAVQVLVTRQPGTTAAARRVATPRAEDLAADGIGVVLPEMHSAPGDYPLADSAPAVHDSAAPDASDPAIVPNLPEYQRDPASEPLSGTPATADDPTRTLAAVLIDPGRGFIDENLSSVATPLPGNGPRVISRAQWGADESLRCSEPTYDDGVSAITVHHTAGRTEYSKAESAGIVRAIYAYHARKLGWCDIGYNALVDKYGQIFEGRAGGLDRPVEGAHAGGFNENTSGVALMGNYGDEAPSEAALQAAGQFIGWRARTAGLDPKGSTTLYSEGTVYSKYDEGEAVRLPIVFAHRDVGNTSCPGDAAYAQMDRIRDIAATEAAAPGAGVSGASGADLGVSSNRPAATAPAPPPGPRIDLNMLADLTTKLLGLVNDNIIAKYWSAQGGPNGRLGAAASEPRRTSDGGQYARFVNGYVYARPDGQVVEVVGRLLDRFLQLGAESGVLGLPTRNAYAVPDGLRSDFQYGSLILNQLTGIVTTLVSYYADVSQRGDQAGVGSRPGTPAVPQGNAPGAAVTPQGNMVTPQGNAVTPQGNAVIPPGNRGAGTPSAAQVPPGANPAWSPGTGSDSGTP
ncbi:N-acetylmuramoyl-L-alanine amidase [Nocardia aurantia]|uniref:N-acetylmuramoyl-L-alanine amidase n=1 Tax=Nocardia aurantia TaxID=2585199 RepID=UPI0038732BC7